MRSVLLVLLAVVLLGLSVGAMAAGSASSSAKAKSYSISGTVTALGSGTITVKRSVLHVLKNRTVVVSVTKSTTYNLGSASAKLSDIKVGQKVLVTLTGKLIGKTATASIVHVKVKK